MFFCGYLVIERDGARNEERCGVWCVAAGCSARVRSACLQLMGPAETRNIEITTSIPARGALLLLQTGHRYITPLLLSPILSAVVSVAVSVPAVVVSVVVVVVSVPVMSVPVVVVAVPVVPVPAVPVAAVVVVPPVVVVAGGRFPPLARQASLVQSPCH